MSQRWGETDLDLLGDLTKPHSARRSFRRGKRGYATEEERRAARQRTMAASRRRKRLIKAGNAP